MATYSPSQLGIKPPKEGFQEGGWYSGRQYWGGTLSDPGVIHEASNQQGAGQAVSREVNAQSAAAQGVSSQQLESYLQQQRQQSANVQPTNGPINQSTFDPGSGSGAGAGMGFSAQATPNFPELFKNFYKDAGIEDIEADLSGKEKEFIETKAKINDNPFLSEATRVGRVAKLEQLYNERTASLRNDIATKKADVETKLNLEMKQFDINSQAAQQALNQFNTLLQMGALSGASGEDIANITRSTGISSQAIYSAINAQKQKDVQTTIQTIDDGKTITAVVMNSQTGEIISKTPLGSSKPSAGAKPSQTEQARYYYQQLEDDAARGVELQDIFRIYGSYIDNPDKILQLYNNNSMYGPAVQAPEELAKRFGTSLPAGYKTDATNQYGY